MKEQINQLLEIIIADYNRFMPDNQRMQEKFAEELVVQEGRKYIKVLTRGGKSVWGFIVNVDNDKQFQYGDVLKAATYKTPARNRARCNLFDEVPEIVANVRWTGPAYL